MPRLTDVERFMSKVRVEDTGYTSPCWRWKGRTNRNGYAQFYYGGSRAKRRTVEAHVWAYRHFVGPVPAGFVLDHLCRIHDCGNPYHVEPVTTRENLLRGEGLTAMWARRTHCEYGHEYTPENTYITKQGARKCRTCNARMAREHRARAKERKQNG